jgi:transposase InsO family protein
MSDTDKFNFFSPVAFADAESLSRMLGLQPATFRQWKKRGQVDAKYIREVPAQGGLSGKKLEFMPIGLPEPYRGKFLELILQDDNFAGPGEYPTLDTEEYLRLPQWKRSEYDKWYTILVNAAGLAGKELKEYCQQHGVSWQTFYRKRDAYVKHGPEALMPKYGINAGRTTVHDADFQLFWSFVASDNKVNYKVAWQLTRAQAIEDGRIQAGDDFPCVQTFINRAKKEKGPVALEISRNGIEKFMQKSGLNITRNWKDLEVNDLWVSDHRQLDVMFFDGKGQPYRPWLTAWIDAKSDCAVGWYLHKEAPNSDHIKIALKWAILAFGAPKEVYIDNGKDYRARDFSGGRNSVRNPHKDTTSQQETTSMLGLLGIKVRFALPYNPQSKVIEPWFKQMRAYLDPLMKGHIGNRPENRPEGVKELLKNPLQKNFPTLEQGRAFLDDAIGIRNNRTRESGRIEGLKPIDLQHQVQRKRMPSKVALDILSMRKTAELTVRKSRVTVHGIEFGNGIELLPYEGQKVFCRFDPQDFNYVLVFSPATSELLCRAEENAYTSPAIARTTEDFERLKDLQKMKAEHRKIAKELADAEPVPDASKLLRTYREQTEKELKPTGTGGPIIERIATPLDQANSRIQEQAKQYQFIPPPAPAPAARGRSLKIFNEEF